MAAYPATLPAPLASGYSLQPNDQTLRTDMDVGPARTRRRTRARLDHVTVAWKFLDDQYAQFRAWFEDDAQAAGGAAWFAINLPVGTGGSVNVEAKFIGPYKVEGRGAMVWQVTADLEVRHA